VDHNIRHLFRIQPAANAHRMRLGAILRSPGQVDNQVIASASLDEQVLPRDRLAVALQRNPAVMGLNVAKWQTRAPGVEIS
jgi:hypothetical protein